LLIYYEQRGRTRIIASLGYRSRTSSVNRKGSARVQWLY